MLGFEAVGKLALGQLPEGPLPFNQIDWSVRPFVPKIAKESPNWAINLNLFTNPIPFGPYDYSKSPTPVKLAKEQPNWSLNLELYKNPIPLGPYDYNTSSFPKYRKDPPNWALNLNLYKNPIPFGPYDYNKVKKPLPVIPDQQLRNAEIFSEVPSKPITWPATYSVNSVKFDNLPNLVLLQAPIIANPFYAQDFSTSHIIPDWAPVTQYPNLALLNTTVATPFFTQDFSSSHLIPDWLPPTQYPNLVLSNPIPFGPYDYNKTIFPIFFRSDASRQLNLPQNVGSPLIPIDWSKPFNIPELVFTQYPNLILLQPTAVNPFYLQDFSRPSVPIPTKYDQQSLNLQLYTNTIPFAQFDWPRPASYIKLVPEQNNLPNIVLSIVFPFYTRDWSKTGFLPSVPSPYMALNINNFTNPVPFNQYDWLKSYSIKPIISDLDNLPNLVLQPIIIVNPFYTQDFSKTQFLPSVPSPYMGTNQNLYVNPIPFNQYDWTKLWPVKPIASDEDTLPNIVLLNPIMPSTPLGIFSWQDWNVNSKVYLSKFPELPNLVIILTPPIPPEEQHVGGRRWKKDYEQLIRELNRQSDDVKQAAATLSSMGGHARAKSLTAKQRANIASKAASIRWK